MNRKIFIFFAAILFGLSFAPAVRAQQLFVSDINVGDGGFPGLGPDTGAGHVSYCNNGVLGSPVSFVTMATTAWPKGNIWANSSRIEFDQPQTGYPGGCLSLCAKIVCVSTVGVFGVNELDFEIFKFVSGGNPLDPASTPPIKTVSLYNIGTCQSTNNQAWNVGGGIVGGGNDNHYYCTAWDGAYNLGGIFGKTNGQFGFRAKVKTNETSPTVGNISIEQTAAFPGQNQIPIGVDVINIHTVRSSPTVVGKITGVAAQPYNILYRLSKDATTTIKIYSAVAVGGQLPLVRTLVQNLPRVGEGTPDGTLTNGDFWDGRENNGEIAPPGVYKVQIDADSQDGWTGIDYAYPYTTTISHDPLQITDAGIKPLGSSSTDQAVISYLLTEAATVYVGIYTADTNFSDINSVGHDQIVTSGKRLRLITEQKTGRQTVSTSWDGRDDYGNPVCDGDYVYAIWAELASGNLVIRNQRLSVGTIPVARGLVISLMSPSSTVIGSSPSVAGLDPFYFRYTPVRDALITMNIMKEGSNTPIRHLISGETRFAGFSNREMWDGRADDGSYVDDGVYEAELVSEDPYACSQTRITTTSVKFPVNMFRIVDVKTTPLLGGASDTATISFEFSQAMYMTLNIYDPDVVVVSSSTWPPILLHHSNTHTADPVFTVSGMRPSRFKITEYWDGRSTAGDLLGDGKYPYTLVASTSPTPGTSSANDRITGYLEVARGQILFTAFDVIPTIPTMYNSSDTVTLPPYEIDYMLTRQSSVTIQIIPNGSSQLPVADVIPHGDEIKDGGIPQRDFWDGKCTTNTPVCSNNDFVPSGSYNVKIIARDIGVNLLSVTTVQQTIDVNPLRIFDMAITPHTADAPGVIAYQVSETMKVVTKIFRPDAQISSCLNNSAPCSPTKLVKMFVGVRPARAQIFEYWDGTDLTLSKVPDGNYVFKVYGSVNTDSVSSIDGTVSTGAVTASDDLVGNIPVANGPTKDDAQLTKDIWFAPNPYTLDPYTGKYNGRFHIPIYINSVLSIKIYNLTGDLIYKYPGTEILAAGTDKLVYWPRTNSAGKLVAPGVYFALIRLEGSDGSKGAFQIVKKILVP